MNHLLKCRNCGGVLRGDSLLLNRFESCGSCQVDAFVKVYPAYFNKVDKGELGEKVLNDKDAPCYVHADRKAVSSCEQCGKFVCQLCEIVDSSEGEGSVLCPQCFSKQLASSGRKGGREEVFLYDGMALGLAVVPLIPPICLFMYWAWIFTAPTALFMAIFYWNRTKTVLPRSKVRNVLAILFGLPQLLIPIGIILLIAFGVTLQGIKE